MFNHREHGDRSSSKFPFVISGHFLFFLSLDSAKMRRKFQNGETGKPYRGFSPRCKSLVELAHQYNYAS